MAEIKCIVGLGNPGPQYEKTRHNIGFLVLDQIARSGSSGAFWKNKFEADFCDLSLEGRSVKLVKPQSFMNLSGEPLREITRFFKIGPAEVVVVHDEVDIPFGSIRLKVGGGDGGHNGLKSITKCLGTRDYLRVRMGVGRPSFGSPGASGEALQESKDSSSIKHSRVGNKLSGWVLGNFPSEQLGVLEEFLDFGAEAVRLVCEKGLKAAQAKVHNKSVGAAR